MKLCISSRLLSNDTKITSKGTRLLYFNSSYSSLNFGTNFKHGGLQTAENTNAITFPFTALLASIVSSSLFRKVCEENIWIHKRGGFVYINDSGQRAGYFFQHRESDTIRDVQELIKFTVF